ncbi:hypothetical protein IGI04_029999 [Brassica rapa subsp. trilocularis]|uniref:Uncharacterized protein n=1 Tax=Brassica rapa subsp. trilocularis TaxID=1813537 RepID=A0ABQ7LPF1_BRACM|nr:hypothetical protein IGI04_029999 [Brassica rapa subsp. trilocularis]
MKLLFGEFGTFGDVLKSRMRPNDLVHKPPGACSGQMQRLSQAAGEIHYSMPDNWKMQRPNDKIKGRWMRVNENLS